MMMIWMVIWMKSWMGMNIINMLMSNLLFFEICPCISCNSLAYTPFQLPVIRIFSCHCFQNFHITAIINEYLFGLLKCLSILRVLLNKPIHICTYIFANIGINIRGGACWRTEIIRTMFWSYSRTRRLYPSIKWRIRQLWIGRIWHLSVRVWVSGKIIERGCIVVRDRNSVALP